MGLIKTPKRCRTLAGLTDSRSSCQNVCFYSCAPFVVRLAGFASRALSDISTRFVGHSPQFIESGRKSRERFLRIVLRRHKVKHDHLPGCFPVYLFPLSYPTRRTQTTPCNEFLGPYREPRIATDPFRRLHGHELSCFLEQTSCLQVALHR